MKFEIDIKQLKEFCMFFHNTPRLEILFKFVLILGFLGLFTGGTLLLFSFALSLVGFQL